MPALGGSTPAKDELYYLDTSGLFPLAYERARHAGEPAPPDELARATTLVPFLRAAQANSASVITSILSIEELAAKWRNTQVRAVLPNGIKTLRVWENTNPIAAANARKTIQASTLKMMAHAANGLGTYGVALMRVAVGSTETRTAADKQRKAHRELLRLYDRIDPMDALHIVVGREMGAERFISFDTAWTTVAEISVYN